MQPVIAIQEGLPGEDIAIATSSITVFQYLGGAVAISLGQTIFRNRLKPALRRYAPDIDAQRLFNVGATGIATVVPPEELDAVILAYNQALRDIFVSTALPFTLHRCQRRSMKILVSGG